MIAFPTKHRVICFVIDENVLESFKELTLQEKASAANIIEQFLLSYVYCLDSSFIGSFPKTRPRIRRISYHVRITIDTYEAFVEKTNRERSDMNLILQRFLMNYTAFVKALRSLETKIED